MGRPSRGPFRARHVTRRAGPWLLLGVLLLAGCSARGATTVVEIGIHHSRFEPQVVSVRAGEPITFAITNTDPIDHEWIVGDEGVHERHRTGSEPTHDERPTEVTVEAGEQRTTVVTFDEPGTFRFICHLPGHEAYGMVGTIEVGRPRP